MRQKLISLGDDFVIEDEQGNPAYKVDGKVMRVRETFVLEDMNGRELATIREKMIAIRDTMTIERNGETAATIKKRLFTPFRDKFDVNVADGKDLVAKGDFLDHEYTIERDDQVIASVSKRWFTIRDTYGIDIAAGEDDPLVLAIAVALDELAHDEKSD